MKSLVVSLGVLLFVSTAAYAQGQTRAATGGGAKQQACRAEAHDLVRRGSGRSGGTNAAAARAQWQGYYQSCMAR